MGPIGKYEIIEQIGAGAMGNVYRALDSALDRAVALKTIRTGVDVDPEVRQRFYREARACARLQHPNIITVFDLGEADNIAYIAMELLEGADFRQIIKEDRSISVEAKIAAAAEVCDAIAHAHRHGVIHRDIKPSNLFLTNEGRAKVLDFGIARLPSSRLTVAGQILGTPNYMAPEQILAHPSDGRADLFSAAVVFFELFTDVHPFQSSFIPRRIVQSEPDSLFDSNSSLPVILEKVMARGLAKDPDQRYQTGAEFAADLRAVLDAIRGNSSPSFSGVQLPSQHVIQVAQLQPGSVSHLAVPDGQDPQEWRLSEALRLLPEFESAIDRRDVAGAQAVIVDLEGRLAGDVRFMEAIRLCRSRLMAANSGDGAPAPALIDRVATLDTSAASAQSRPDPQSRLDAAGSAGFDLDTTFFGPSAKATVDQPSRPSRSSLSDAPAQRDLSPHATHAAREVPPRASSEPDAIISPVLGRRKALSITAGVVVCATLVLAGGIAALRPIPVEPAAATAVVRATSANIYVGPNSSGSKIASVPRDTQLSVLRLPASRNQEWINVQLVKPRVYRPGYIRIAELRNWYGQTGMAALALIRVLDSGATQSEEEINARIQKFSNLVSRFAGEPAAREAQLEIARLRFSLAQWQKAAGRPSEDWQSELKTAHEEVALLSGDQSFRAQTLDLTRQIDELLAEMPAVTVDPSHKAEVTQQPQPDVSALLTRAKQLRSDGDYQDAEKLILDILRISPNNRAARALRDKIKQARDAENK